MTMMMMMMMMMMTKWGGWSTPRPGRITSGKDPVPIVQEPGWAPESVWKGAENLATTWIRSLDSPARSESLYRLSHPGLLLVLGSIIFITKRGNSKTRNTKAFLRLGRWTLPNLFLVACLAC
jgi:hypothetical protein